MRGVFYLERQWFCGLGQGDPLSCYLFVLAVDVLFWALQALEGVGSMFGFCDDGEVEVLEALHMPEIQRLIMFFECASGQVISKSKSKIYSK